MKKLIEYLNGKTIALVGNAQSILDKPRDIDKKDVVIRMNKGFPTLDNIDKIGNRTDVLALSMTLPEDFLNISDIKYMLYCTPKNREYASEHYKIPLVFYPKDDWNNLKEELHARPSTGCMVMDFITQYVDYLELHLYGFDFMDSPTWYTGNKHTGPHDYEEEQFYVNELMKKSKRIYFHE